MITSRWIFLRIRNIWDKVVEKLIKTFVFKNIFPKNRTFCEIMRNVLLGAERPDNINTVHAHCVMESKTTNTHSEYVKFIALPRQQWSYERAFLAKYIRSGSILQAFACRVQLKCKGARWRTGEEVKGKLVNAVGSQYPSHYLGTRCIQHFYP